jgi:predicted thioesterase
VRIVARLDGLDGRKVRARSAVVDEDGTVYAVASAFHVAVTALPDPPA